MCRHGHDPLLPPGETFVPRSCHPGIARVETSHLPACAPVRQWPEDESARCNGELEKLSGDLPQCR